MKNFNIRLSRYTRLPVMRFNVVFFVVWLVAVVYTAPVPLRRLMPRSPQSPDSVGQGEPTYYGDKVKSVQINYDPDGVPKDWGTEDVRIEKAESSMKVFVIKALKDHTKVVPPEKDDKDVWEIKQKTLEDKEKADLTYMVLGSQGMTIGFNQGGWINITDMIVTLPTK
ncbi:hypothetical protein F5878DRAFT_626990 [Lentinula raphanica]|uniref:Uncharacterized protein n=1 Tax=Lentinula raphanica TaxID=153919 RepID=A0AA38P3V2_9AGAR|nr:hypothetical protein F5878DRAFT_626990 [Lentinula raphanica]